MAEEFEGDLAGSVFWGADLRGAVFRDVDLAGARISHAWLGDVEIDATIDRLVVNGVDVTEYVNAHDAWYPLRSMLRAATPPAIATAWAAFENAFADTVARARALPDAASHQSVDGEFSFVQTVRHLVFAVDKWFTVPVLGLPFAAMGLPNTGSMSFPWPGLDQTMDVSADEALALWADRATRFAERIAAVEETDLQTPVDVLENGPHTLLDCIHTVFEETFWHNRYARRDLEQLAAPG